MNEISEISEMSKLETIIALFFIEGIFGFVVYILWLMIAKGNVAVNIIFIPIQLAVVGFMGLILTQALEDLFKSKGGENEHN